MNTCLVIVDCQNDFVEGGSLAVKGGIQACHSIVNLLKKNQYQTIAVTQDFHPADHCSFVTEGGTWPAHCVGNSPGSLLQHDIAAALADVISRGDEVTISVVHKGKDRLKEEYGATITAPDSDVFIITGIALDFCVLETAKLTKQRYPASHVIIKASCTAAVNSSTESRKRIAGECTSSLIEFEE